jgi:hypothetical protein
MKANINKIIILIFLFSSNNVFAKRKRPNIDKTTIKGNIITLEDGNPKNADKWTFLGPNNKELGVKHINTDKLRKKLTKLGQKNKTKKVPFKRIKFFVLSMSIKNTD